MTTAQDPPAGSEEGRETTDPFTEKTRAATETGPGEADDDYEGPDPTEDEQGEGDDEDQAV